jgi:hypothetical protein
MPSSDGTLNGSRYKKVSLLQFRDQIAQSLFGGSDFLLDFPHHFVFLPLLEE